jgi:hypothetical protein
VSPLGEDDPGWGPILAFWALMLLLIAIVVVGVLTL